jgi:predicted HTH transcriptional regulator
MKSESELEQVLAIIRAGDFHRLIDRMEGDQIECKGAPYSLNADKERFELAKDVTAFANTKGGLILIGVHTVKDEGLSADVIKRMTFPRLLHQS